MFLVKSLYHYIYNNIEESLNLNYLLLELIKVRNKYLKSVKKTILDSYAIHLNNFLPHAVLRYRFVKLYKLKLKLLSVWKKMTLVQSVFFYYKEMNLKKLLKRNLSDEIYSDFLIEMKRVKRFLKN